MTGNKPNGFLRLLRVIHNSVAYALSLPERTVRSVAALVGGGTSLLTDTLLPASLRGSSSYRITVGLFQEFLIERVAGIEREAKVGQVRLKDKFIQRKMLGNVLEAAGLLTMRLSPLWVLAIAADAAGGSKTFLNRLVEQLKINKVIPEDAAPSELEDVLAAIQAASHTSAAAVDMPPLSREELARLAEDMKMSYAKVFEETGDLVGKLDELWEGMKLLARKENISLERLMGIMTVDAANFVKKSIGSVAAVGQTGVNLFDEAILDSYRKTLEQVSKEGIDGYLNKHLAPFLNAAKEHFNPKRRTWLERLLGRS
jgi:hypothetical protein